MKRLFWLGIGLAVGAYVTHRASAAARDLTPAHLADGLRELGAGIGAFGAEVRAGMTERERELAELVERRTGAPLPSYSDVLSESLTEPIPVVRPGARARRAGAPR
ncbi:hypothetical protein BJF78_35065 [Pseudonocardia sp. CNS-139]|nr:hypothetical protein BJF78_35065 [Pseudonocardia sp. CNS-139]